MSINFRAVAKTFITSFVGAEALYFGSAGAEGFHSITSVGALERFGLGAGTAALAAAGHALIDVVKTYGPSLAANAKGDAEEAAAINAVIDAFLAQSSKPKAPVDGVPVHSQTAGANPPAPTA